MANAEKFRKRISKAVFVPPLVLCLMSAASFGILIRLNWLLDQVAHRDHLIDQATTTTRLLIGQEGPPVAPTDSGSPGKAGPHREAGGRLSEAFDDLARLIADDADQSRLLARIRKQGERRGVATGGDQARPSGVGGDPGGSTRDREPRDGIWIFLAAFLETEVARRDSLADEARFLSRVALPGSVGGGIIVVACLSLLSGKRLLALGSSFEEMEDQADLQEEERLTLISEAIRYYAIFNLDNEGRITSWNQDAERILGYRSGEVLARNIACLYSPEDVRRDMPENDLTWAIQEGRAEDLRWIVRKDGFRFKARVSIVAIRDDAGDLCGFTNVIHEIAQNDE